MLSTYVDSQNIANIKKLQITNIADITNKEVQ